MSLFKTVPPNDVRAIRAFHIEDLQNEAKRLRHHFLYASLANASTKQNVLKEIEQAFCFPKGWGKNFDALADCLTDLPYNAGKQYGFVIVLDQLPNSPKFDKDARETLLEVFRDSAEFWADKKIPFRVFYSFHW